jgi:hypothetical protein
MEIGAVSVGLHHGGQRGAKPKTEVIVDILAGIKDAPGLNLMIEVISKPQASPKFD